MATSKIDEYIRANDDADAFAAAEIEGLEQAAREDIDDLVTSEENRDSDFWESLKATPDETVDDYDEVEPEDRDNEWLLGLSLLFVAGSTQFYLDNRDRTIVRPLAYRLQALDGLQLTRAELVEAGKRTTRTAAAGRFAELEGEYLDRFAPMLEMSNAELYEYLRDLNAIKPLDTMVAERMTAVSRMTEYQAGSPQFRAGVVALIESEATTTQAMNERRTIERIYSYEQADGDMDTLMVWIGEGGPNACQYCVARYGKVKTYRQWLKEGLPGAGVCAGADRCRCHLAAS